jgi:hypothetical protein
MNRILREMGFLKRASFLFVGFLAAVYTSNMILVSRLVPAGLVRDSKLHVICRGVSNDAQEADVLFHHGEYGSGLQFLFMMEELAKQNVSSCSYDLPDYGFSVGAANASCPVKAKVHVSHSSGAVLAFKCSKKPKQLVLLDPLLRDSVDEDWTKYRVWLARPIDNDYLLIRTGFARLLRVLRLWQPWLFVCFGFPLVFFFFFFRSSHRLGLKRYGSQLEEWDVQLLPSHAEKIRRMFLFGDLLTWLRSAPKLPKITKGFVQAFFADTYKGEAEVRVLNRKRVKAVLVANYEANSDTKVLQGFTMNEMVRNAEVLEHIVKQVKK